MVKVIDSFCRAITALMAVALMIMVVLVFGNVVLRYGFNSSITQSEEISRWLFVWITFMGAVVALREHGHLGTDALVSRLPPMGKKVCLVLGHLTMLYVCYLVFQGAWNRPASTWTCWRLPRSCRWRCCTQLASCSRSAPASCCCWTCGCCSAAHERRRPGDDPGIRRSGRAAIGSMATTSPNNTELREPP